MRLLDARDARHPPVERLVGDELPVPRRVQRGARPLLHRQPRRVGVARRNLVFGPATLTTGWRPIVLVTTPPQPASKARMMLLSDSVGGAEASRNGFSNRSPVNVTLNWLAMAPCVGKAYYTLVRSPVVWRPFGVGNPRRPSAVPDSGPIGQRRSRMPRDVSSAA